ncbi:type II toxin-antitoxin system VapC family toxin [uncultured Sphingomonas sp.]|uniref:type II toxin-antitoxin system VapC family toxin n=1 Tax=uncultured Sphingomonas sp. TaxID=158754 RepID=UPI0035CC4475
MTLFIDASALVALAADEPERRALSARLADDNNPIWSAMTYWEAVSALCWSYKLDAPAARHRIVEVLAPMPIRLVTIGAVEADLALEAYERYGKGRHPARLNLGDCFAYACAKANGAQLLYKGGNFARTDLA